MNWYLYAIECQGGGVYIGITTNVKRRFDQHCRARGALYTKINRPVTLYGAVEVGSYSNGRILESKLKKMSRKEKLRVIKELMCDQFIGSKHIDSNIC